MDMILLNASHNYHKQKSNAGAQGSYDIHPHGIVKVRLQGIRPNLARPVQEI
jgi:hypothetical protein